jgi:hypothetical protein
MTTRRESAIARLHVLFWGMVAIAETWKVESVCLASPSVVLRWERFVFLLLTCSKSRQSCSWRTGVIKCFFCSLSVSAGRAGGTRIKISPLLYVDRENDTITPWS